MVDLQTENVVSLVQAANFLPRLDGKRVHPCSIWRWCREGVRGVKLAHDCTGGRVVTSLRSERPWRSSRLVGAQLGESQAGQKGRELG